MMEAKSSELRRSRRCSHKVSYNEWWDKDYVAPEVLPSDSNRDELTHRGFVSYIEDVTAIEFATLDDMKLYDSVADKLGIACCASFNEFSRPFRGFSEEERCSSENCLFRFKKSINNRDCVKSSCVDSGDDTQRVNLTNSVVLKPIVSSGGNKKARFKAKFTKSSTSGPRRKKSRVPCSAAAKYQKKEHDEVISLLTPTSSPTASSCSQTGPSRDSGFGISVEYELLLTPEGSSTFLEQESHHPDNVPPVKDFVDLGPISMASIPYIFKCCASHDCQNPKICANESSFFTLCLKLTTGKGKAFSKLATKYLDEYKECNVIDRLSATIAASAVDSSVSSIFLPIKKELISRLFPQSNKTRSMDPYINKDRLSEFSNHEESSCSSNEPTGFHEDPITFEHLQSKVQKHSTSDDPFSDSSCSNVVKYFIGKNELLHDLPTTRSAYLIATKDPLTKRLLESSSFSEHESSPKISKGGSKPVEWSLKTRADSNFILDNFKSSLDVFASSTPELDPLSMDYQAHHNKSPMQNAFRRTQHIEQARHISKRRRKSQNGPSSSTESLNCTSAGSVASSNPENEQPECSSTSLNLLSHCIPITPEKYTDNSFKGVIDLTTENGSATVDHHLRTGKRKRLLPRAFQLPEEVILIDDDDDLHPDESYTFEPNGESCKVRRLESMRSVSPVSKRDGGLRRVNTTLNLDDCIIDLTEGSEIGETPSNSREKIIDLTVGDPSHPPLEDILDANLPPDNLNTGLLPGSSGIGETLSNSEENFTDLTQEDLLHCPSEEILEARPPSDKLGSAGLSGSSGIGETLSNSEENFTDLTQEDSLPSPLEEILDTRPPSDKLGSAGLTGSSGIGETLSGSKEKFVEVAEGNLLHLLEETIPSSDKMGSAGLTGSSGIRETLSSSKKNFTDHTEGDLLHRPSEEILETRPPSDKLGSAGLTGSSGFGETLSNSEENFTNLNEGDSLQSKLEEILETRPPSDKLGSAGLTGSSGIGETLSGSKEKFVEVAEGNLLHLLEETIPSSDKMGSAGLTGSSGIRETLSSSKKNFTDHTEGDLLHRPSEEILETRPPSDKLGSAGLTGSSGFGETLSNSEENFTNLNEGDSLQSKLEEILETRPPSDKLGSAGLTGSSGIGETLSGSKEKFVEVAEGNLLHLLEELETIPSSDKMGSAGLTGSSGIGETLSSSKKNFTDLSEGNLLHHPSEEILETRPPSDKLDSISGKDGTFNEKTEILTKSLETPCHGGVTPKRLSVSASLQELSVMCTTAPSLGYIKVGKYPTGELVLNETFTARVYKHFDDLKALNTYLNQRFAKMSGVSAQGPLKWILVTAGVIKLKKVRPINPKVWFHPHDYFLTNHDSDNELVVLPKPSKPKVTAVINSASSSCSSPPEPIGQAEPGNMSKKPCVITVATSNSTTPTKSEVTFEKPKAARLVSILLNKEHTQKLDTFVCDNKQMTRNKVNANQIIPTIPYAKIIKPNRESLTTPQIIIHPGGRSLPDVNDITGTTHHVGISSVDSQHNISAGNQSFTNTTNNSKGSSQSEVTGKLSLRPKIIQTFSLNSVPSECQPHLKATVHWGPKTGSIANKLSNIVSNHTPFGATQNMTVPNFEKRQAVVHQYKMSSGGTVSISCSTPSVALLPTKGVAQSAASESSKNVGLEKPNISRPGTVLVNSLANQPIVNLQHKVQVTSTTSKVPSNNGQAVKVVLTHQPNVFPGTTRSVKLLPYKEGDQPTSRAASLNMSSNVLQKSCASKPMVFWVNQPNGRSLKRPGTLTPSVNIQTVQPSNTHNLSSSNMTATPAHSVLNKLVTQTTNQSKSSTAHPVTVMLNSPRPQDDQKSSNVPRIILNKPTGPQNEVIHQPMKRVPLVTTNAQGAITRLTAAPVTTTSNPGMYSDAMIYFASDRNSISGIPVRKFPSTVGGVPADQSKILQPPAKLHRAALNMQT